MMDIKSEKRTHTQNYLYSSSFLLKCKVTLHFIVCKLKISSIPRNIYDEILKSTLPPQKTN